MMTAILPCRSFLVLDGCALGICLFLTLLRPEKLVYFKYEQRRHVDVATLLSSEQIGKLKDRSIWVSRDQHVAVRWYFCD